jgi:hypothetical protein
MHITGKLHIVKRLKNSVCGNPKYLCSIETENGDFTTFETRTNSSYGYSITNYENKIITVELNYFRNNLSLDLIK